MHPFDPLHSSSIELDTDNVSDEDIQSYIDDRLYDELAHRAMLGNAIYIALFFWVVYATSVLAYNPIATLIAGCVIVVSCMLRVSCQMPLFEAFMSKQLRSIVFSGSTLLIAAAWSGLAICAIAEDWNSGMLHQDVLLMAVFLLSVVGGAVNVLAIAPKLLQSFLTIMLLPMLCGLFFIGTHTALALASFFVFGFVFSWGAGNRIYVDYRQRLEHEFRLERKTALLKTARDVALEAVRSKAAFLANMSHEIRTPMNGVLSISALLLDTELNSKQHVFVQAIKRSGDALLCIINDILDFSKTEAGKMTLEKQVFCYRTVVEDVADMAFVEAFEKGVDLVVDMPTDLPDHVLGDSGRLRQVMVNLVSNAVKFTASGEVVMAVEVLDRNVNSVALRCSIRDTGVGIESEKLCDVFDPFTQADVSTTRNFGGTGLGLAICKQLVDMMGGSITAESEPGKGSKFVVDIEFERADESRDTMLPCDAWQGMRALIVDASVASAHVLSNQLLAWGIRTELLHEEAQVIAALNKAQSDGDAYDMLLMDMHISDGGVLPLVHQLRAVEADRVATPILLMTSCSLDEQQVVEADICVDALIAKPVRQSSLYQGVCDVLNGHRALLSTQPHNSQPVGADALDACVLLAEDHDVNQMIAQELLEAFGCRVKLAVDGMQAVQVFQDSAIGTIDVILMDCQMPKLDGYDACREIRALEQHGHVPIIALTAHAMQGDKEQCLDAGMDDYLSKPFTREQLFEMLLKHLPESCQRGCLPTNDAEAEKGVDMTNAMQSSNKQPCQTMAKETVIDDSVVQLLPGGPDMAKKVFRMFLKSLDGLMQDMEAGVRQSDTDQIMRAAHTLKSSSAMLGALALAQQCQNIEKVARAEGLSDLASMVEEARQTAQKVVLEIDRVYLSDLNDLNAT